MVDKDAAVLAMAACSLFAGVAVASVITPYEPNTVCPAGKEGFLSTAAAEIEMNCLARKAANEVLSCTQLGLLGEMKELVAANVVARSARTWCVIGGHTETPHGTENVAHLLKYEDIELDADFVEGSCAEPVALSIRDGGVSFTLGGKDYVGHINSGGWVYAKRSDRSGVAFGPLSAIEIDDDQCGSGTIRYSWVQRVKRDFVENGI